METGLVTVTETPYEIVRHFTITAHLNKAGKVVALVDTGATANFIHPAVVKKLGLPTIPRKRKLKVIHVKGGRVGIVDRQVKCYMRIRDREGHSHREIITFDVVPVGRHQVILGLPWFRTHKPYFHWDDLTMEFISPYCKDQCLLERGLGINCITTEELEILEVKTEELDSNWKKIVPKEYHDFADVFDIRKARKLPPLRGEWDFKIDLIKGAPLPPRS